MVRNHELCYDPSMTDEPESLMLKLLRDMRAELGEMRADLKSDMHSLRADMAADLIDVRKDLGAQIVGLRRAVVDYHTSVIGHGVLISDLDARLRRVEQHLNLSGSDPH